MSVQNIIREAISIIGVMGTIVLGSASIVLLGLILWLVFFVEE